MQQIKIDIISDVVCPWCYLGEKRLSLALDALKGEVEAEVTFKPFQLEPNTPPEGFDTFDYLAKKIGADRVRQSHEMLKGLGAEIGLPFELEKATRFPNTLDAHRLIHWAGMIGEEVQQKIAAALFRANFVESKDVSDHNVLSHIAGDAGMDRKNVAAMLAGDIDRDTIRESIEQAQHMGVSGVPFFVIEDKYAVTGAQSVEVFTNALRQIAEMKAKAA